jgi:hypothetical protein
VRAVQLDGFADLFQHELPVSFQIVAGQALGAAGYHDGVKELHANALGKLVQHQVKAMVKTPDDGCIGFIAFTWRVEMEYLADRAPRRRDIISLDAFWRSVKLGQAPGLAERPVSRRAGAGIENLTPQMGGNNSFPPYTSF